MFFVIKEIQGKNYLYKMTSRRVNGVPTHEQVYVGSVSKILSAIPKKELIEVYNGKS
jgi:hypothetical protein